MVYHPKIYGNGRLNKVKLVETQQTKGGGRYQPPTNLTGYQLFYICSQSQILRHTLLSSGYSLYGESCP